MQVEMPDQPGADRRERAHRSLRIFSAVVSAVFCLIMGIFLVIAPWMEPWDTNFFSFLSPDSFREATFAEWWRGVWSSNYFRGAISGLGVLNIYIAFLEAFRLRRFARED